MIIKELINYIHIFRVCVCVWVHTLLEDKRTGESKSSAGDKPGGIEK